MRSAPFPSVYQPGDLQFGPQSGQVTERPAGFVQQFAGQDKPSITEVPLPGDLADIPFTLQNLILEPSRVFVRGLDFDIEPTRRLLRFHTDLFADPFIPKRDVFDAQGNKSDEELALWIYKGQYDQQFLQVQFGYALVSVLPSQ